MSSYFDLNDKISGRAAFSHHKHMRGVFIWSLSPDVNSLSVSVNQSVNVKPDLAKLSRALLSPASLTDMMPLKCDPCCEIVCVCVCVRGWVWVGAWVWPYPNFLTFSHTHQGICDLTAKNTLINSSSSSFHPVRDQSHFCYSHLRLSFSRLFKD